MKLVLDSLVQFLNIYSILLIVRILLSWFQTAEWAGQVISFLAPVTDPYLNIFRSIIPPLGGLDVSAILALILLQFVQGSLDSYATASMSSGFFG